MGLNKNQICPGDLTPFTEMTAFLTTQGNATSIINQGSVYTCSFLFCSTDLTVNPYVNTSILIREALTINLGIQYSKFPTFLFFQMVWSISGSAFPSTFQNQFSISTKISTQSLGHLSTTPPSWTLSSNFCSPSNDSLYSTRRYRRERKFPSPSLTLHQISFCLTLLSTCLLPYSFSNASKRELHFGPNLLTLLKEGLSKFPSPSFLEVHMSRISFAFILSSSFLLHCPHSLLPFPDSSFFLFGGKGK